MSKNNEAGYSFAGPERINTKSKAERLNKSEIESLFFSLEHNSYVAIDFETTGLSAINDRILEIGAVAFKIKLAKNAWTVIPEGKFETLINPARSIESKVSSIHGIDDLTVSSAPYFPEIANSFLNFINGSVLIAHNLDFDLGFLYSELARSKIPMPPNPAYDSIAIAKTAIAGLPSYSLKSLAKAFDIKQEQAHRASDDARVARDIFCYCINLIYARI